MKRVLITGATGFIGRHTLKYCRAKGYEVHAISSRRQAGLDSDVNWHRVSLLEPSDVQGAVASVKPTHLLHLAWYAEPGKYWHSTENYRWLEASVRLMRAFREGGGTRAVMAGTCAEYDWRYGYCSENVTPLRPRTPYSVCKNAMQEVLASYGSNEGLSTAWGRVFFLYGPEESPIRFVASVISSIMRGDPALCSHGNQIRDYLHVEDVASAFVALLDSGVTGPVNIASGRPIAIRQIAEAIASRLDREELLRLGAIPVAENDQPVVLADIRRLSEEVGWRPAFDLERGLDDTIAWWLDSGQFAGPDDRSSANHSRERRVVS